MHVQTRFLSSLKRSGMPFTLMIGPSKPSIQHQATFVSTFCGTLAQERATEYADFMNDTRN